ncbi:MAG: hypothetical protein HFE81_00935 [Bacilli bacterium]|nr:hypothetical protein [Bacilli bacterium]
MASFNISVNEKLCANCMKSANDSADKIVKLMGKTGDNKNSTIIGCVERMNKGFKDTAAVAKLYDDFNKSLATLKVRLNAVDAGFQSIDKVV